MTTKDLPRDPLPPEFDLSYYRTAHADLSGFTDEQLAAHYRSFGAKESRACSAAALRETFIECVKRERSVLEIGPFCNPCVSGPNVSYFDVLDTPGLLARAREVGYPHKGAPVIEFVSATGDLGIVDREFDAVISSHCIEHQPDLVRHLHQVSRILTHHGRYYLLIPDKRYCFDHFICESTIAGVLDAHAEKRQVHRLASIVEHRALTTHNDTARHWAGDHANPDHLQTIVDRTRMAITEHENAKGGYVDVHAWQFTPSSFRFICDTLHALGLTDLQIERVYSTPRGRNEFTAVLRKP